MSKNTSAQPQPLKIGQAAKTLGVSIDTLRRWEGAGKISAQRTEGGTRYYSPFVKIGEAAKILGVSIDTLRRWERSGKIKAVRTPGATRLYSLEELSNLSTIPSAADFPPTTQELLERNPPSPQNEYSHFSHPAVLETLIKQKIEESLNTQIMPKKIYAKIYAGAVLSLVLVLLGTTLTVGVLNFDLIRQIGQKAEKTPAKQQEQNVLAASTIAQVGKFLEVNADTVITGNLATDGFAIFREGLTTSTLEASDSATIAGNTSIGGTTTLSSTLSVAGLSTLTGGLTTPGKLTLTGNAAETLLIKPASDPSSATKLFVIQNAAGTEKASVTSSGDASFAGKLDVTGATTLSSTLKVSGATTLSSTVTVSGATTLSSSLEVSGTTTLSGAIVGSSAGAASAPGLKLTGTWYTGGSTTTTKPQLLIEPTDTTSTAWSSSGTGLGINAKSTFTGNLIDAQLSGASKFSVDYQGNVIAANITSSGTTTFPDGSVTAPSITFTNDTNTGVYRSGTDTLDFTSGGVRTLSLPTATSGVNYVTITPAATGSGPTIAAAGSDTNIALTINSLLTGALTLDSTSTGTVNLGTSNNAKIINVGTGTGGNTINIAGTGATGADTINIGTGGTGADTITIGTTTASSSLALNDDNWNITGAGAANFVSVGATTAGSGAFTTLTSSGNSTIGTGASSVNTIGSTTTPGTLTLHGATTLDNTFSQTGTNTFGTGTGAVSLNGDTTIAANKNLALTSGTGTFTQTYSNTTGTAATWAITDSASSGTTTVKGLAVNITGTANAAGTNTITGIDFGNVAAATNNTYYGLNFGTGFNDILRYNGTQVINGSGQVVSTQISGTLFSNSSDSNSGTNTIIQGDTLTINGGTNGIDTTLSNDTYTLNLDTTEIGAATFGSGSGFTWTFDAGATDPTIAFASNQITIGSAATLTATDVTAFNCTDCIDFDDLDDTLDIDATTTINTTATTTNPLSYLADSISTGTALIISADALSTGTAMDVSSTSTAGGASGTSKLLNLARSGANANTAHTAYGIYSAVTNTNATSGTNVAGYFSASGATTNNYALYANAGSSYFATTQTVASAASATLDAFNIPASTITVSGSTNITTATGFNLVNIGQPTLSNASIAVTNAATLYIANAPTASGGGSITNPYALWVDAGDVRLDGVLQMPLGTEGAPSYTFQGDTDTGMFSTAADELALAAGGQARIKIATTGAGGLFGPLVDFLRSDGNAAVRIGINDGGGTVGVITGTSALQVGNENTSVQFGQSASQRGITTITAYGYGVSGGADFFTLTPGAHTAMTAEKSDLVVSAHTNTITGGYATQRFSLFAQPTISAATGLTVTTASTLNIAAAPTIASSAVITNAYGLQVGGATTLAGAASTTYGAIDIPAHTVTDSTTTQITSSPAVAGMRIGQITVAQSGGAVTVDNAASLYIANAPTAGASVTLTNPYALWVDAGTSAFGGNIVPDANDGAALGTTSLMWSDLFLASGSVVNFNNGDVTLTHGTDALTLAGGVFVAPLGSASAPPYTFTGDTNTGIYSSTGDSIDFSIGGSQKLQLTSSSDEFKVWGNLAFQDTISNNNGFISGSSTHNVLAFQNNGAAYGMGAFNSSNTFTSPLFNIVPWGYNVGANYTQTAEMIALQINWPAHANTPIVGGNITTQRVAYIKQPTFTGTVSERTITNSYGLFVDPATAGSLM
ncbi:MerR family DNA-binding transcriptional regulator, partial [Candidatus Daviesbacteria bacterium]|nr:MerR family DNA-binding transcriptional regulator [Candidatus Daviesbacteria bacterium]